MKKLIYSLILICLILSSSYSYGQLFNQDFNSSANLSSYWNASPTQNQFNEITNSASFTSTIQNGVLRCVKQGAWGVLYRSTNIGTPNSSLIVRFKFRIYGNTAGGTNQISFYVGSGLPGKADAISTSTCHSRFGINFADPTIYPEGFSLRNLETNTNSSVFLGTQYITMAINNSGSTKTYISPANTIETQADDKIDLWVGNTKVFDDVAAYGTSVALDNFKLLYVYGAQYATMEIDDFSIYPWKSWSNSFVNINANGSGDNTYWIGQNPGNGTELNNHNFDSVSSLKITGANLGYLSDALERSGSSLYYRIMSEDGLTTVVDTTSIPLVQQLNGTNYNGTFSGSVDLLTGLPTNTTYKLHVWAKSMGTEGNCLLNNGNLNYVTTFIKSPITGLNDINDCSIRMYTIGNNLVIQADLITNIEIYSVNGQLLDEENISGTYSKRLNAGIYILRAYNKNYKIIIK